MQTISKIMADVTASITDFKTNPNIILEQSQGEAVAILKSNQPYFYAVPKELFEAMAEVLEDQALLQQAKHRLEDGQELINIEIDDL